MWKQTIWYPFAQASAYGRGELIYASERGPMIPTPRYGSQPAVESIVTREPETGVVTVFAINRSVTETAPLRVELKSNRAYSLALASRLHDDNPYAGNTADAPNSVVPRSIEDATVAGSVLQSMLPPLSWNVFRLSPSS
jgi:alpha-N-arabinofuranosidase